jgi:hypothetical protein
MARIRSVHPGFFADESFVTMSPLARLFWIGLLTEADDQGIFEWKPVTLKIRLLALENVEIADLLKELEAADAIRKFEFGDKPFGAIRNFRKFQSPQKPRNIHGLAPGIAAYVGINEPPKNGKAPESNGQGNEQVGDEYDTPTVPVQEASGTERRGGDKEEDKEKEELSSLRSESPPSGKPKRVRKAYSEQFEKSFWTQYPSIKNADKSVTFKIWQTLCDQDRDDAIAGLDGYRAFCRADPTYRCLHPDRYLSRRRWEAYMPTDSVRSDVAAHPRVFVEQGTPEWEAWQVYARATKGRGSPVREENGKAGWAFPSSMPPPLENTMPLQ